MGGADADDSGREERLDIQVQWLVSAERTQGVDGWQSHDQARVQAKQRGRDHRRARQQRPRRVRELQHESRGPEAELQGEPAQEEHRV